MKGRGRGVRGEGEGRGRGARVSRRAAPETGTFSGGHGRDAIGRSLCSASPTPASKRSKAASKAANTEIDASDASGGGTRHARRCGCIRGMLARSVARFLASTCARRRLGLGLGLGLGLRLGLRLRLRLSIGVRLRLRDVVRFLALACEEDSSPEASANLPSSTPRQRQRQIKLRRPPASAGLG